MTHSTQKQHHHNIKLIDNKSVISSNVLIVIFNERHSVTGYIW